MTSAGYSSLVAAALFYGASTWPALAENGFSAGSEHHHGGKHHHDGTYAVDITTKHGDCDRHHHWTILVSSGHVSSAGTKMSASGHITPHGHVHLTFKRFHHIATITGRLTTGAGSGTWHSPSLECSGSWHAHRQT
jgi:hypothetical protein